MYRREIWIPIKTQETITGNQTVEESVVVPGTAEIA